MSSMEYCLFSREAPTYITSIIVLGVLLSMMDKRDCLVVVVGEIEMRDREPGG